VEQWFRRKIHQRKRMKTCPQCSTGYPDSHTTCPIHGVQLNEIRDLKPGMVIRNTYRIVRKLGQGGMGAVYLAQHTLMDEPQALKFLSSELSHDEAFTARFLREVRTLRQIRHKNVVDAGNLEPSEDGTLFFSMEFVDGPDLRAFLNNASYYSAQQLDSEAMYQGTASAVPQTPLKKRGALAPAGSEDTEGGGGFNPRIMPTQSTRALAPEGSLPVELALSITRQIAEGLGAAHSKGMVHRDIKPENILLKRDAGAWLPKIADFGIVATKESSTAYTRTGGTLLTMAYAAPEQWRGTPAAQLDGRTDLYALGGLLYEMLTGQTPFHAENYEGWSRQHQTTPPQPPSALRPDLANWQGLDALVLRLLAKDRNDRPKDVAELLGLIDAMRYLPSKALNVTEIDDSWKSPKPVLHTSARKLPIRAEWLTLMVAWLIVVAIVVVWFITQRSKQPKTDKEITFNLSDIKQLPPDHLPLDFKGWDKPKVALPLSSADSGVRGLPPGSIVEPIKSSIQGQNINKIEQKAETLLDQNRFAEAIPLFAQTCDAGIARGCSDLAYLYNQGKGVAQDDIRAGVLAIKACNAGDGYGCDSIGEIYEKGIGVTADYSSAVEFFTKACNERNSNGCYNLGQMYDSGEGVIKDSSQAAAYYSKACNAGSAEGCNQLAYMYDNGIGVAKDSQKARQFITKSCNMGNKWGCDQLKKIQ
jgi:hypothetical protein